MAASDADAEEERLPTESGRGSAQVINCGIPDICTYTNQQSEKRFKYLLT